MRENFNINCFSVNNYARLARMVERVVPSEPEYGGDWAPSRHTGKCVCRSTTIQNIIMFYSCVNCTVRCQ